MNSDSGVATACSRHPSQTITGFCSACLTERLSTAGTAYRSSSDIVFPVVFNQKEEDRAAVADVPGTSSGTRVRKTLLYLFQLDDQLKNEHAGGKGSEPDWSAFAMPYPNRGNGFGDGFQSQNDRTRNIETDSEIKNVNPGSGTSSVRNVHTSTDTSKATAKSSYLRAKGLPLWIGSVFSRSMFRSMNVPKKSSRRVSELEKRNSAGTEQHRSETDLNTMQSSSQKLSTYPDNNAWEDPRHLWDGMMVKEPACPPAFLSNLDHRKTSPMRSKKKKLVEEVTSVQSPSISDVKINRNTNASVEGFTSAHPELVDPTSGTYHEETQQANTVSKLKRPLGCGKAWYRSITNPWKDIFSKHGSPFRRSFSESWPDDHKWRNSASFKADTGEDFQATTVSSVERQHESIRSKSTINGNVHRFRPDSQSKDFRFSRSRSLHYSSPANLENGLLRFYLTPLRSSRGVAGRRASVLLPRVF